MVLATILQCALLSTLQSQPNAADAWNKLFAQIQNDEIPDGEQSQWTDFEQAQYEKLAPFIKQAREIALMPHCDWNLDYSQGLELLLPHLGDIRQAGKLVSVSIQEDVNAGKFDSALLGMESLVGMSKHLNDQGTIISSLVSYSVFKMDNKLVSIFNQTNNAAQLSSLKNAIDTLDPFDPFGIRESAVGEKSLITNSLRNKDIKDLDLGGFVEEPISTGLDLELEITKYESVMDRAIEILNMPNKTEALGAAEKLSEEVDAGEHGELTKVFLFSIDRIIESAFDASEDVKEIQFLLQQRIDVLTGPNSATYFLQAVDTYCAVDENERRDAPEREEFAVLHESLELLAKAAEMQPTRITLSEESAVPLWLAPIFVMTIDGLARGNPSDFVTALRVAGHLSMQERLAASVTASMIVEEVIRLLPDQLSEEEISLLLEATRRVPAADAFMILTTTDQDKTRFQQWMSTEEGWNPTPMALLAATITLTKEKDELPCGEAWARWIEILGVPDDDTVVLAAVTQNMPETLLLAEFENEQKFVQRLRQAKNKLPTLRRKLTTLPARR
jgi:hypothetical protein